MRETDDADRRAPAPGEARPQQLFVIDPLARLNPAKDTSVALMQALQRAGGQAWCCELADLSAEPHPDGGYGAWVRATPLELAEMGCREGQWVVPDPWVRRGAAERVPLDRFPVVWMRKDPPVDEAYLYATHLLELGERRGVRVINRPASLRAWNEKLSALRFGHRMAPTVVSSRVDTLARFARDQGEVVLKPLAGRAGQGVVFASAAMPGLRALLELVTQMEALPVMAQAFLSGVKAGDKRILLVDGEPLGAVNRVPSDGEFRSNLAVGGQPMATELTAVERDLCAELAPVLRSEGLFFVGIDVIDGRLSEINVTSPTGVREVERLGACPLADQTIARLLASSPTGNS
ncbi:MAG: glutathione synthase [Cyanobacteriota bacterium]|nr:glutathione synthase [Cyanobacteriota bacterium]